MDVRQLLERAQMDLARAESREGKAREALEAAVAEGERLRAFVQTLTEYVQAETKAEKFSSSRESPKADRFQRIAEDAILQARRPLSIDEIRQAIKARGVSIGGGERENAYLASYLSKADRIAFIRSVGWWLEGQPWPHAQACDGSPESTPPSGANQPEGGRAPIDGARSSGNEHRALSVEKRSSQPLEPKPYRTGGGGT